MRKHTQPQETQPFEFLFICIDEDFMFVWVDIFARIQKDYQCNAESTPLTVMNETPISKADKFVCLRVPTGVYLASSTCQTGSRYDYQLPRPHSQGSWSETTNAAYQTEAFQVSKVLLHRKALMATTENKCDEAKGRTCKSLITALWGFDTIKARSTSEPAAAMLWQQWYPAPFRTA